MKKKTGIIVIGCFECYARIFYDLNNDEIKDFKIQEPLPLLRTAVKENYGTCPFCARSIKFYEKNKNSRGEQLAFCPQCTNLIIIREEESEPHTKHPEPHTKHPNPHTKHHH